MAHVWKGAEIDIRGCMSGGLPSGAVYRGYRSIKSEAMGGKRCVAEPCLEFVRRLKDIDW